MDTARFENILNYFKELIEKLKAIIEDILAFKENPYVDETSTAAN